MPLTKNQHVLCCISKLTTPFFYYYFILFIYFFFLKNNIMHLILLKLSKELKKAFTFKDAKRFFESLIRTILF